MLQFQRGDLGEFSMVNMVSARTAALWICVQVSSWSSVAAQQIDPEVGLTAQEQVLLLYDIKLQCLQNISEHDPAGRPFHPHLPFASTSVWSCRFSFIISLCGSLRCPNRMSQYISALWIHYMDIQQNG
ncbi:hypothetical protein MHYP_G00299720 [Metynnis hypsauchen]